MDGGFLSLEGRPLVLYVIQQRDFSGAEIMHLPVMRRDVDPLLACPPASPTEELALRAGVPTTALPFRSLRHSGGLLETIRSVFRGLAGARDLRRIAAANPQRTIIYCTALRPALMASLATIGIRRKLLWHVPEFMPPPPLWQVVRLLAIWRCDRAIAHSQAVAEDFVRHSRRLRTRTSVVYPGTPETAAEDGVGPGHPRAAIVGSITRTKRVDFAVEITRLVSTQVPDFELLVVGRPQFRASDFEFARALRSQVAADARLRDRVRFVGWTDDVAGLLRGCGMLLHCCAKEPFGIALIEAMALGRPVVAPKAGGPAEIVEHGISGFLYEPSDAQEAASQLRRLVSDRSLAAELGHAARRRVQQRFSAQRQLEETERILADLAD